MNPLTRTAARRLAVVVAWLWSSAVLHAAEEQAPAQTNLPAARSSIYMRVPRETATPATLHEPLPRVLLPSTAAHNATPDAVPSPVPLARRDMTVGASELWLVSTRRLPKAAPPAAALGFAPDVFRFVARQGWIPSSLEELVRSRNPAATTNIFIHGNDTNAEQAADGGRKLYDQLLSDTAAQSSPTRLIIWSWPNEATSVRVRKAAQTNAQRGILESYFLASFLRIIAPQSPITIVGYSSGAGITTGGLHVLAGGAIDGRSPAATLSPPPGSIQAVLLGAAMPNDLLLPGMAHERALSQVDRLVITVNPIDGVLQWYPMLWGRGGAPALGVTGIPDASRLGPAKTKITQVNMQAAMQRNHGWRYHTAAPEIVSLLRHEMLHAPADRLRRENAVAQQARPVAAPGPAQR